jgi:hypothetical protein
MVYVVSADSRVPERWAHVVYVPECDAARA